jgi:hypothetical protein
MLVDDTFHMLSSLLLHVADGNKLDVWLLKEAGEIVLAAAPNSDPTDNDPLARGQGTIESEG